MSILHLFKKNESPPQADSVAYVVVGLGNPGQKYAGTRHNAGFEALALLEKQCNTKADRLRFKALTGEARIAGQRVLLLAPQTFMNLSGEAVRDALAWYKLPPDRLIVLYDDVALSPGRLRIRKKGSDGGHNGIKNIIYHLHTDVFARVKIGVGSPPHPQYDMADWVLGRFDASDAKAVLDACARAAEAVEAIIDRGPDWAANKYNAQGGPAGE